MFHKRVSRILSTVGGGGVSSMHWAGGCVSQHALGRGCLPRGRGVYPGGCLARGRGGYPRDGHYRERYASYWNAFLLELAPTSHDDCGYCLLLHHVSSPSVSSTTAATQRYHYYYDHPASTKTQFKIEDGYQIGKN